MERPIRTVMVLTGRRLREQRRTAITARFRQNGLRQFEHEMGAGLRRLVRYGWISSLTLVSGLFGTRYLDVRRLRRHRRCRRAQREGRYTLFNFGAR